MWVYFPDNILINWRRQLKDIKNAMIDVLYQDFPSPPKGYQFNKGQDDIPYESCVEVPARNRKNGGEYRQPGACSTIKR